MTAPAVCKYAVDQLVEVQHPDFTRPSAPMTWFPGRVVAVTPRDTGAVLWDVKVLRDDHLWSLQIVGPRGGNKRIRPRSAEYAAPTPLPLDRTVRRALAGERHAAADNLARILDRSDTEDALRQSLRRYIDRLAASE